MSCLQHFGGSSAVASVIALRKTCSRQVWHQMWVHFRVTLFVSGTSSVQIMQSLQLRSVVVAWR